MSHPPSFGFLADISGSYAGHAAANALAGSLWRGDRVVLIDANDFAVHVPLVPRSLVTGEVRSAPLRTSTVFKPGHHVVVRARVIAVRDGEVELDTEFEGSTRIKFAACILALGSAGIGKPELGMSLETYKRGIEEESETIRDAKEVLIAGGGPTGVTLAAELTQAYPDKRLVLVHCRQYLAYSRRDGESYQLTEGQKAISEQLFGPLCARGVWIHVNERVSPDGKMLELVGTPVTAHVLWCDGPKVAERTDLLDRNLVGPDGRIGVDEYFRTKMPNVYAVGDCADTEGRNTIAQAMREGAACARILLAHLGGKGAEYDQMEDETYVVPLGPKGGTYPRAVDGYEDGAGAGIVDFGWLGTWPAPDWYLTRMHRDYFHSSFRGLFKGAESV